jgi:hypothetical protein
MPHATLAAITVCLAVAAQPAPQVTKYQAPLAAQYQRLQQLQSSFEALLSAKNPDKARVQAAGAELAKEVQATQKLLGDFCSAQTRHGLQSELQAVRDILAALDQMQQMNRRLGGAKPPELTDRDKAAVRSQWEGVLRDVVREKLAERLGSEGLADVLTAGSLAEAEQLAADRLGAQLRKEVGDEMERLTGLRIFDTVSLGDSLKVKARQVAEQSISRLLVKLTSNQLLISVGTTILIDWLGPKLKEALREKGNLDARTARSIGTLKAARDDLNRFTGTARLSDVARAVDRAEGTINATKYLRQDLAHSNRPNKAALSKELQAAITNLNRTIDLTRRRFPSVDCNKEFPGWSARLAAIERELKAATTGAAPAPAAAGGDRCPPGYRWDRMSGVGCMQADCAQVAPGNSHYSYTGQCICNSEVACYVCVDYSAYDRKACGPFCPVSRLVACLPKGQACPKR